MSVGMIIIITVSVIVAGVVTLAGINNLAAYKTEARKQESEIAQEALKASAILIKIDSIETTHWTKREIQQRFLEAEELTDRDVKVFNAGYKYGVENTKQKSKDAATARRW